MHPDPVQVGDDLDPAADHAPGAPSSRWCPGARSGPAAAAARSRHPVAGATGGSASIAARSASTRSAGRAAQRPRRRAFASASHALQLGVEVGRAGERAAGQERASPGSRGPARPAPWPPGRPGLQMITFAAEGAAERLALARSARLRPPRHRPTAPSPSQTSTRGTAPAAASSCHQPAIQVLRRAGSGSAPRDSHREYPPTIVSTGSCVAVRSARTRPAAGCRGTRSRTARSRPAHTLVREAGSGGRYDRPQLARPGPSAPSDRAVPADPLGDHRRRHRRARLQQLPDPRLDRVHHRPRRRPLVPRRPVRGQRRLHRVPRAPHHPRDLLDRHPLRPVQPADLSPVLHGQHPLPPGLAVEDRIRQGVSFHLPSGGQFSRAVDIVDA